MAYLPGVTPLPQSRCRRRLLPSLALVPVVLAAGPLLAQFEDTEVSPPGSATPLRFDADAGLWTWEDLSGTGPGPVSYGFHRRDRRAGAWSCLEGGLVLPSRPADAESPSSGVFWYLVTARSCGVENRPGVGRDDRGAPLPRAVPACAAGPGGPDLDTVEVATGYSYPVLALSPPGDLDRLFIVAKNGIVDVMEGANPPRLFLDLTARVVTTGESGLLSLAFHPDFPADPRFFVFYSSLLTRSIVSEFRLAPGPELRGDESSERVVLDADHFATYWHWGGMLAFRGDADGDRLYVSLGDAGRPADAGSRRSLLGKILRIDVDAPPDPGLGYHVPATNPFFSDPDPAVRKEIWALGFRNPWRFSFDRRTGDLYVADVGNQCWEEIDVEPAASPGGADYGWNRVEGNHCVAAVCSADPCGAPGAVPPVFEYAHSDTVGPPPVGCSVIGGYVYRGCALDGHQGRYFFGDACSRWLYSLEWDGAGGYRDLADRTPLVPTPVIGFGEDAAGELYLLTTTSVRKLVPR